jgi:hypothetical protein
MRNLILFLIAISLGTFTYFFQELGDQEKRSTLEAKNRLLDPSELGELLGFKTPNIHILKEKGIFILSTSRHAINKGSLQKFFDLLGQIKVQRILKDSEYRKEKRKDYFPNEIEKFDFSFSTGKVSFLMGKKLSFSRTFYVEVTNPQGIKTQVVAHDPSILEGVYSDHSAEVTDEKYRRLKSLLFLDSNFFMDKRPFRFWDGKNIVIEKMDFNNRRNRSFSLNIMNRTTYPLLPDGIKVKDQSVSQISLKLRSIEGTEIFKKGNKEELKEKIGNYTVFIKNGEKYLFEVFNKFNKERGYFLSLNNDPDIYQMSKRDVEFLFYNVQDFWDLRPIDKMPPVITFNKKVISISDGKQFKTSHQSLKTNHHSFYKLINFLKQEASQYLFRFSPDKGQYLFNLILRGGEFRVILWEGSVILYRPLYKDGLLFTTWEKGKFPINVKDYIYE